MSILVIGSLAYDSIETPFGSVENALGGSANYIALAASYLSDDIDVVSIIGDDYAHSDLKLLHDRGIRTEGVEMKDGGKTFRWSGRYHHDLNTRDTLDTQLNVLLEFDPQLSDRARSMQFICLGNLDPKVQASVLDQVESPTFTVCDTMNFWIENTPDALRDMLKKVDCLIINDSEARELADDPSLIRSARKIRDWGPDTLVIKKGEHGALLFTDDDVFSAPAWPLEEVFDPTGAGDTFAGGFIGYLARHNDVSPRTLRGAVVHGSALASYCVEKFSVGGLLDLNHDAIRERVRSFRRLSHFELEEDSVGTSAA
jgi:sugar/nucleoside kinase (ribokinase family)